MNELRCSSKWHFEYEHFIIVAFLLAVHMEDLLVVQSLLNWDPSIKYLCTLAIDGYSEYEIAKIKIT
jgi:hypothetical protein